ncbi:MAG: DUF6056 family protein [Clostridia bacterium]
MGLIQFFLLIGKPLFDVLNALVFGIFTVLIGKVLCKKTNVLSISSVILLVLFAGKVFWDKFIWMSGSLNYLWCVTSMLVVIYYFYKIIIENRKLKKYEIPLLLLLSFFSGWSQENTIFVLGSFLGMITVLNIKKIKMLEKREKIVLVLSVVLFIVGAVILLIAPGNYARLGDGKRIFDFKGILTNMDVFIKLSVVFIIISCVNLAVDFKSNKKEVINQFLYFIVPVIIALIPMTIIPVFPSRSMLPYEVCFYICIVSSVCIFAEWLHKSNKKHMRIIYYLLTTTSVFIAIASLIYYTTFTIKYIKPYKEYIAKEVSNTKKEGKKEIVLNEFTELEKAKKMQINMEMFPNILENQCASYYIARYYKLDFVIAIPDKTTCVEVKLNEENKDSNLNIINKENGDILARRITPESQYGFFPVMRYDKAVFCIKTEDIDNMKIDIDKSLVKEIKIKNKDVVKTFDN